MSATDHTAKRSGPHIVYVAYPPLTMQAANAVQTYATVSALRALAPDSELLVPRFGRRESVWTSVGARHLARVPLNAGQHVVRSVGWSYAERTLFAWRALLRLVRLRLSGRPAGVVYVRDAVCAAWLAMLAPRMAATTVIYEVHNLEATNPSANSGPCTRWLAGRIDRHAIGSASGVVSLTETFLTLLRDRHLLPANTPVATIPDAYNDAVFAPRDRDSARAALRLPTDAFIVVYTGLTFAYRGLDRLVAAFGATYAERSHALLLLVGGREQEREALQAQARGLGIGDAVQTIPPQPNSAIPNYLAAADVLVLPDTVSKESASPLKLFEYAAMERPIVATDMPALREILSDDAAIYMPANDISALTEALTWIATHPAEVRVRAVNARLAVARHTYAARAAAVLEACRAVIRAGG
jgi:glycosyltransferase involved in cell wall biosynthesis